MSPPHKRGEGARARQPQATCLRAAAINGGLAARLHAHGHGHAFGVAPQATCGDVMQAALLSKVANQLYVGYLRELLMDYYGSEPDGVVVRPYLATFYAHVMDADGTLFSTCQISAGVGRDVSTTGRRVNQYGLTELAATADGRRASR